MKTKSTFFKLETAMGYKQESFKESDSYRQKLYILGDMFIYRGVRPWLIPNMMYSILGYQAKMVKFLESVHNYTIQIINKRRRDFFQRKEILQNLNENM